jgi:hypothetical protein
LGAATKVDKLEIHWPSGTVEQFPVSGVDRIIAVIEGKGVSIQ